MRRRPGDEGGGVYLAALGFADAPMRRCADILTNSVKMSAAKQDSIEDAEGNKDNTTKHRISQVDTKLFTPLRTAIQPNTENTMNRIEEEYEGMAYDIASEISDDCLKYENFRPIAELVPEYVNPWQLPEKVKEYLRMKVYAILTRRAEL